MGECQEINNMNSLQHYDFKLALEASVVRRALVMAAIVGTILVFINHGMCIVNGKFGGMCLFQSALTFFVPYAVSTISSVMAMSEKNRSGDK